MERGQILDIRRALRNQDQNPYIEVLSALRSILSVKSGDTVAPQDEMFTLVVRWMQSSAGAHDILEIWEGLCRFITPMSLLSSVFTLLSSHVPHTLHSNHQSALVAKMMREMASYLSGSNELILVSLKLLITISHFGDGREQKTLFEAEPWNMKTLVKVSSMRRKGEGRHRG